MPPSYNMEIKYRRKRLFLISFLPNAVIGKRNANIQIMLDIFERDF